MVVIYWLKNIERYIKYFGGICVEKSWFMRKRNKFLQMVIYSRTLFLLIAFLFQFAFLGSVYVWLRDYSLLIHFLFIVLGFLVVVHLCIGNEVPEFKLVWMLIVAVFPLFGALFYIYITFQPGVSKMEKKLSQLSEYTKDYVVDNKGVYIDFINRNPSSKNFVDYMLGKGNASLFNGTNSRFFSLGDDMFPVILEELKKAEKFIFLEYFIIEDGEMWSKILDVLIEKVKMGVEVRVMYDGTCAFALMPYFYPDVLKSYGIKAKMFSPIKPLFSSHYNNRDHRKILVIDGLVAFTGGINLADEYINHIVKCGHWKDTGILLRGEAVASFTYMFLEMWNIDEVEIDDYALYRTKISEDIDSDGYYIPFGVSPFGRERIGKRVYLDILNTAKNYVHIMTPYLIVDYEMVMALIYAAKRGVDVCLIIPHIPDNAYVFAVAKTYYSELVEAGIKIYEYKPGFVHAKICVSDDYFAVVSTINMDYRSLYHHFECGVCIYNSTQVLEIEKDFNNTKDLSILIDKNNYKKQNLFQVLIGKVVRIFAPLM